MYQTGLDQEDHDDWAESAMVGAHLLLQWEGVDEEGENGGICLGIDNIPLPFCKLFLGVWGGIFSFTKKPFQIATKVGAVDLLINYYM